MIIVLKGADGSGKSTQAKKLYEHLTKKGYECELMKFPYYDSATGKKIKKYLDCELKMTTLEFTRAQYENKLEKNETIQKYLNEGKIIILDRYSLSTYVYAAANYDEPERTKIISTVKNWQKNLVKISLGFFLDLPLKISNERTGERAENKDLFEKNNEYMKKVYEVYKTEAEKEGYAIINCANHEGLQNSRDEIFKEILNSIKSKTSLNV
ncbi:hypothetical protein COS64_00630 [archaeon CG06_land_8_20_14_3_00_37_11]|nr:MAG: hypothetical protein COS64_00630 [archaeon CG06_land_8_20_14_3_00_37_11]